MVFEERLTNLIPSGANLHGIYSLKESPNVTIIEYDIDGVMGRSNFTKCDVETLFTKPVLVPYTSELTVSGLYQYISDKYHLGLVEGIDYLPNSSMVSQSGLVQSFGLETTSYGYKGSIPVLIVEPTSVVLLGNKDIRGYDLSSSLEQVRIQQKLGWKVFSFDGKMFSGYVLSITFRNKVIEYLGSDVSGELIDDLGYGYIEKSFNDGLSDLLILRTPMGRSYFIRFSSTRGDIPQVK